MADNELKPHNRLRHGHARHTESGKQTATYASWASMRARCKYRHRDKEDKYVNRGITVCDEWHSFDQFLADMGERPDGTTLDRIDNNLPYSAKNCQWSTPVAQARNRRNAKLTFDDAKAMVLRMLSGETAAHIARVYGTSESLPREIMKGRTWKDAYLAATEEYDARK